MSEQTAMNTARERRARVHQHYMHAPQVFLDTWKVAVKMAGPRLFMAAAGYIQPHSLDDVEEVGYGDTADKVAPPKQTATVNVPPTPAQSSTGSTSSVSHAMDAADRLAATGSGEPSAGQPGPPETPCQPRRAAAG